ncbi:MAG: sodium transport system permease protein [Pirellulaceae bacterium]|jgi:sodium transport system permease protein
MSETSQNKTSSSEGIQVTIGRLKRLCLKELREILRDRRTIVTLVLMPLLAYPLISIAFQRFVFTAAVGTQPAQVLVMTRTEQEQNNLSYAVQVGEAKWRSLNPPPKSVGAPDSSPENEAESTAPTSPSLDIQWYHSLNPEEASLTQHVRQGRVDVAVEIVENESKQPIVCQFIYRVDSPIASRTVAYLKSRIRVFNQIDLQKRLDDAGEPTAVVFSFEEKTIGESASVAMSLLTLLPLILVLMTVTGAVYPAIDLTAGERERGTLELLIATPMPRIYILLAKYVAVLVVALLTATVNLIAMTAAVYFSGLGQALFREGDLTLATFGIVGMLLVVFACFFSALLLAITSIARSFKEAQAYLIPLMLFSISPGMIALVPNLELTLPLAIVPLLNMVLLARDLVSGEGSLHLLGLAVFSTAIYTVVALHFAALNFGQNVINDTSADGWSKLWGNRKSAHSVPTLAAGLIVAILLFHFQYVWTGELGRLHELGVPVLVALMGLGTVLLFGLLPSVYVFFMKHSFANTFRLVGFHWPFILGALLLGLSVWVVELTILSKLNFIRLTGEQQEQAAAMVAKWRELSPAVILVSFAILPAIFEEFFFRGFLLSSLRSAGNRRAIVWSAVIFGVFHIVSGGGLAIERFVPSMLVGLIFGWIAVHSGSIIPGIVMHMTNNATITMLTYYRNDLVAKGWIDAKQEGVPLTWLVAGLVATSVGVRMCVWATRHSDEESTAT